MNGTYLWLYVLFALVPFAVSIFVLSRAATRDTFSQSWRKKVWLIGMIVVTLFSLTLVFALSLNLFPPSAAIKTTDAYSMWLLLSVVMVPSAAILIGFGEGRLRWLGFLSAAITAACIIFAIVAAGAGMAGI